MTDILECPNGCGYTVDLYDYNTRRVSPERCSFELSYRCPNCADHFYYEEAIDDEEEQMQNGFLYVEPFTAIVKNSRATCTSSGRIFGIYKIKPECKIPRPNKQGIVKQSMAMINIPNFTIEAFDIELKPEMKVKIQGHWYLHWRNTVKQTETWYFKVNSIEKME